MTTRITITNHGPKDINVVGGTGNVPGGRRVYAGTEFSFHVAEGYGLSVTEQAIAMADPAQAPLPLVQHTEDYDKVIQAEAAKVLSFAAAPVEEAAPVVSGGGGDFAGAGASGTWEAVPAPSPASAEAPAEAPAPAPTSSWE